MQFSIHHNSIVIARIARRIAEAIVLTQYMEVCRQALESTASNTRTVVIGRGLTAWATRVVPQSRLPQVVQARGVEVANIPTKYPRASVLRLSQPQLYSVSLIDAAQSPEDWEQALQLFSPCFLLMHPATTKHQVLRARWT
jgi:hypothetical protein